MSTPFQRPWWELVSAEFLDQYSALVRDYMDLEARYCRTLCPMVRRELKRLRDQVEETNRQIRAAIEADRDAAAAELVEGGVA